MQSARGGAGENSSTNESTRRSGKFKKCAPVSREPGADITNLQVVGVAYAETAVVPIKASEEPPPDLSEPLACQAYEPAEGQRDDFLLRIAEEDRRQRWKLSGQPHWRTEARAPMQSEDAKRAIDDAIAAMQQTMDASGLDSEWTSALSSLLAPLCGRSRDLRRALELHGWMGSQFKSPPERERLLADLLRMKCVVQESHRMKSGDLNAKGQSSLAPVGTRPGQASTPQQAVAKTTSSSGIPPAPLPVNTGLFEAIDRFSSLDSENPQHVTEYASDIFSSMYRDEAFFMPRPDYMESQTDINGKMRAILVDWLVEVHMKYRLRVETLFLAVHLIDRYLSRKSIARRRLQLVGVAAMFVAAKYEEINPPEVLDFVHVTDKAFTKNDILLMECSMLTTLCFEIKCPTVAHFLDCMLLANQCTAVHGEVVQYLTQLALQEYGMIRYSASHLAAAALLLSNELMRPGQPVWPALMVQHTRHPESVLRGCADEMRALLQGASASSLQAVRKKFLLPQHHSVASKQFR
eukprot:gnl/TRDRNA2_/TRDRNA2_88863_c0_seq1.p1 gnl/TRDRNA2_/TRDRNA2_88863_c0~~gnl/TRDRNA2_/TRDRNA2_88863_c0_seq1.p1  ORF type:complete len:540 (-),score=104.43 gnl/TRDRNA2_/TRDRNA2_88863_c0_seq1:86-1651(-)